LSAGGWLRQPFQNLTRRPVLKTLLVSLVVGGIAGMAGSQILMYPIQHCTYGSNASPFEYRIGVVVTAVSTLFLLIPLWTWMNRRFNLAAYRSTAGYFRNNGLPYLLLLPTVLLLIIFLYYPASQMITLSLKARIFPLPQERFVCLQNYALLKDNIIYQNSFTTTLFITAAIVILSIALSLAVAVLASQKVKGADFYRTLLVWPYAISPVVTGVIFLSLFREGGAGVINWALDNTLGIQPRWIRSEELAPWVIVLASVWNVMGFNILFYVAGLQNIPQDLLEAAALDGANRVQRFVRITFPLLTPFTFFLLVTNVTFSFYGIYGVVDTLTQGGPPLGPAGSEGGATNVLIHKLYQDGFQSGAPIGQAAAQSLILFLLVGLMTLVQFRYIERRVTYGD
ncbi:MAG: sugar ABC transporter permease, partial [Anaerolineae bacterium]|nr:sugar ABC transporter permease [Anaerolineae bacterium]